MSSSDDDFPAEYVLYENRDDWKDITPMFQNDGNKSVVNILYSERFFDVYNMLRAILNRDELSTRALALTQDALKLNAANYTVWYYRRRIINYLQSDLSDELSYVEQVIKNNAKNYQVWHHRRVIIEWLGNASLELSFTAKILEQDAKNYHAWQHRQWVIKKFDLWDGELHYTDKLLSKDLRNNSAWNQRYFIVQHFQFNKDMIDAEVHFVINRISLVKNNESAWNYLNALLQKAFENTKSKVFDFSKGLFEAGHRSPYLLAFLFELYVEKRLQGQADMEEMSANANSLCLLLQNQVDSIRKKYWIYIAQKFQNNIAQT